MSRKHLLLLIALSVVIIGAVVFAIANHHDDSGPTFIPVNEGLIGTASFDVADTEYSGTWTKGKIFAIEKGDYIQLRAVGEVCMGKDDRIGISIGVAPTGNMADFHRPDFTTVSAYSDLDNLDNGLVAITKTSAKIGFTELWERPAATGSGSFIVDFRTTDTFDREQGIIRILIGAGSGPGIEHPAHEIVTIVLD